MSTFRYQTIASLLIERIQSGVYPSHHKLPSIRQLSHELAVSKGTIIRCYEYLEDEGWITAKEKSGFFPVYDPSPNTPSLIDAKQLAQLQPRTVDNKSMAIDIVRSAGQMGQIPFGSANPCATFPAVRQLYQALKKQVQIEQQQLENNILSNYQVPPGDPILGQQLSLHLAEKDIQSLPEESVITNGTQAAITLALQVTTKEDDIVLIESPCFYGILQCLQALNRQVVEIPQCSEGGPDLILLEAALTTGQKQQWPIKAILLQPTVNNPTGRTMPLAHRKKLLQLANQYDIAVIEDDVFADLHYQHKETKPIPLKAMDTENRVLYCSSISKTLTPKLRIGWILAGRWHEACEHLQFVSKMGLPSHTQRALGNWLATGKMNRHLRLIRRSYQQRGENLQEALKQYWPENIEYTPPSGGYLAWVKLPEDSNALDLYQDAQIKNISTTPGPLFSCQGHYGQYIRLNFAMFQNQPEYLEAMAYLGHIISDTAS